MLSGLSSQRERWFITRLLVFHQHDLGGDGIQSMSQEASGCGRPAEEQKHSRGSALTYRSADRIFRLLGKRHRVASVT